MDLYIINLYFFLENYGLWVGLYSVDWEVLWNNL